MLNQGFVTAINRVPRGKLHQIVTHCVVGSVGGRNRCDGIYRESDRSIGRASARPITKAQRFINRAPNNNVLTGGFPWPNNKKE